MIIYGLLPIVIGLIILMNRKFILDYSDKLNQKNGIPINRQIMDKRLIVASIFLIILGIIGLAKTI